MKRLSKKKTQENGNGKIQEAENIWGFWGGGGEVYGGRGNLTETKSAENLWKFFSVREEEDDEKEKNWGNGISRKEKLGKY